MKKTLIAIIAWASVSVMSLDAQTVIPLHSQPDGKYMVDATVNGVGVKTYYAEENWFASMSSTTYLFLYENGYIADADVRGMTVVKMPDGSSTKAGSFVIRNLRLGNLIVQDLPAFVIAKQNVPLIIGNSAFDIFGDVHVEDEKLYIEDGIELAEDEAFTLMTYRDSLKRALQKHIEAKEYEAAADCFTEISQNEPLTMFEKYQQIMVSHILDRDEETLAYSLDWLAENEGKSDNLEYWVHAAMGDVYAVAKDSANAIACYERAVNVYYRMFNTTEAGIRRSPFTDESLGNTLYSLGVQYAAQKNLKQAEKCCSLAAKCGNADAKAFCDKYRVRY